MQVASLTSGDLSIDALIGGAYIPRATYRFQFSPTFPFAEAENLVGYLNDLGISDLFASPIFTPRPGSTHGYDVCDYGTINRELGGEAGFAALSTALRAHSLGLILDIVPNHMGIGVEANAWWMDVLENGPSSLYASYFDIEWRPVKPELANKVLLPVLGDSYGRVLEAGQLHLTYDDGAFFITYYDLRLPVAPRTYSHILAPPLEQLTAELGASDPALLEYQSILTAISYLPLRTETDPARLAERNREKEIIKRRVAALVAANPTVRAALDAALHAFNGQVGNARSFDQLDALLDDQAYRPAFWRVAAEEINYRRFFDINELAAIRTEDPVVFRDTHQLVFRLLSEGSVTGLRLDHVDGLYDPTGYLQRLQEEYAALVVRTAAARQAGATHDPAALEAQVRAQLAARFATRTNAVPDPAPGWPLYVVAEKILGPGEALPSDWPVAGTTGYEFLNAVNGLFVDGGAAAQFDQIYHTATGITMPFPQLINTTKKMIMLVSMASEIAMLSYRLERIAEQNRRYRDFTLDTLTFALREVIAALPVYRTYITDPAQITERDRYYIGRALAEARRRNPRTAAAVFEFIHETVLLQNLDYFSEENQPRVREWVGKFQQLTGPVMAKGVEDTAFYVYNRLTSLNEVGGHPDHFGTTVAAFHSHNRAALRAWPATMLTSSTHDTKRSEDVRARINVLSELPDRWGESLMRWRINAAPYRTLVADAPAPDGNDEYLFYQTLIGAWPFAAPIAGAQSDPAPDLVLDPAAPPWSSFRDRLLAYMEKATREAKQHTSWINPNQDYDAALRQFISSMMDPERNGAFLEDIRAVAAHCAFYGQVNSLAQTLLKFTAPGVPDLYQGCELWDLSLVDPDNRRPIDYGLRRRLLAELRARIDGAGADRRALCHDLLATSADGRAKLYLTERALGLRRALPELFAEGDYVPLEAYGTFREHVVAFARVLDDRAILVVAPRLAATLGAAQMRFPLGVEVWADTSIALPLALADRDFASWLTGERPQANMVDGQPGLKLAELLAAFPVALLTGRRA